MPPHHTEQHMEQLNKICFTNFSLMSGNCCIIASLNGVHYGMCDGGFFAVEEGTDIVWQGGYVEEELLYVGVVVPGGPSVVVPAARHHHKLLADSTAPHVKLFPHRRRHQRVVRPAHY